jgi:integrase
LTIFVGRNVGNSTSNNVATNKTGAVMKLNDTKLKNAKTTDKPIKLSDGGGLFLLVQPNGKKGWRLSYRFEGKQKTLSLGVYPDVSLKKARVKREEFRELLADGIDPSEARKAAKAIEKVAEESFEAIARDWHLRKHSKEVSTGHASTTLKRLESKVFPWIGSDPINEITPPQLLSVLRRIETAGALETAHRIKSICGQVFRYAVAIGKAERDPTADLRGVLPAADKNHLAAITDPSKIPPLLKAIDEYEGSIVTRAALRLAPLVFVRPGELRHAEWEEINLDAAEWNIPAGKMKMKHAHLVPLSRQACDVLKEIQAITGGGRYVFPSVRSLDRPMSDNTINGALRRLGYEKTEMTGHGFRATARTLLDEVLQVRPDLIEHQLAHTVKDALGRAYNRTQHLEERRKMMQTWSDYLDGLKKGAKVVPIRAKA